MAYRQEQDNTLFFHEIVKEAKAVHDYTTEQFIMGFFIPEQLEEECAVGKVVGDHFLTFEMMAHKSVLLQSKS